MSARRKANVSRAAAVRRSIALNPRSLIRAIGAFRPWREYERGVVMRGTIKEPRVGGGSVWFFETRRGEEERVPFGGFPRGNPPETLTRRFALSTRAGDASVAPS